jgi:hypothetical protein
MEIMYYFFSQVMVLLCEGFGFGRSIKEFANQKGTELHHLWIKI